LADQVIAAEHKLWPTPRANDPEKRGDFDIHDPRNGLPAAVRRWPTPRTPTGGGQMERKTSGGGIRKLEDAVSKEEWYNTGKLNPTWVEWLMGFPPGWTDLKPLATDKFRKWLESFGSY
jgi:hypothetical protein